MSLSENTLEQFLEIWSVEMSVSTKSIFKATAAAVVSAWVANAIIYSVTRAIGMIPGDILVPPKNEALALIGVLIDTTGFTLIGALVYAGFLKWSNRPVTGFRWLALGVVMVGFAYPLLIPNIPLSMYIALNLMHIIGGIVVVAALTGLAVPEKEQAL